MSNIAQVIVIAGTTELPTERMRMESARVRKDAEDWSKKIGRTVYWFEKNHTAYAVIGAEQ